MRVCRLIQSPRGTRSWAFARKFSLFLSARSLPNFSSLLAVTVFSSSLGISKDFEDLVSRRLSSVLGPWRENFSDSNSSQRGREYESL